MLDIVRRISESGYFIRLQDFWIFIVGAKTDAWISRLRADLGDHKAFETIYSESDDPWESVSPRFRYQGLKYRVLVSLLPRNRKFRRGLDLGCGLGSLSRLLSEHAESVLGLDVAQAAVNRARVAHKEISNLQFEQGDILNLSPELNGQFDLVTITDTIYYLSLKNDEALRALALRISTLLVPGGICMLTNHFFFPWDKETKFSQRIHEIFSQSSRFTFVSEHWRPFYLTTLLASAATLPDAITGAGL